MYERHFGLKKSPFPAKPAGTEVFVGPQTAQTMANLRKAMVARDAAVLVSGPAGVGKSTLVAKALDALATTHKTIRIGRMHFEGNDILEFLLEELKVVELPRGPIRQFAALREQLRKLEANHMRLAIVVEDAVRGGVETLAELEALTAADAGESGGAVIILMGDERLRGLLQDPQLARLAQRTRLQHTIAPLCAAELRGYLMHCFRLAGVDFEYIFDPASAALLHDLTGGIPRITNNIVESTMTAAAAANVNPIPSSFLATVAKNEFHLETGAMPDPVEAESPAPGLESEPNMVWEPDADSDPDTESGPVTHAETDADLEMIPVSDEIPELGFVTASAPDSDVTRDPFIVFADEAEMEPLLEDDDIPELIQDTLSDLEIIAPEAVMADVDFPDAAPPEPQPEPESETTTESVSESAAEDVPDWERDPTIAELRPDLDALEKAMAFAHGDRSDDPPLMPGPELPLAVPEIALARDVAEDIPEITLDNAIQSRIEDNLIDEPGQISPNDPEKSVTADDAAAATEIRIEPRKAKKADAELEKIAAELAKAKTIEDVDDNLAETLFGEELNFIAAQVVASRSADEPANDEELRLFDTAAAAMAQSAGSQSHEVSLETDQQSFDPLASQRLKTVRALNTDMMPRATESTDISEPPQPSNASSAIPESIEDQINTSMTQTLKALNVEPPISDKSNGVQLADDDDDADEKKGGFFSRFKRS